MSTAVTVPTTQRDDLDVGDGLSAPRSMNGEGSKSIGAPSGAIILGGDYRGLGIARSLGRRKIPVLIFRDEHGVAAHSRYVKRVIPWHSASNHDTVQRLVELAQQLPGEWALFPTTDQMTALIAHNRDVLERHFILTTERAEVVEVAEDKRKSHELAQRNGIAFPRTWLASNVEEAEGLDLPFPVILKPAKKESSNQLTHEKAWKVSGRAELARQFRRACRLLPADQVMIQDIIPGDGHQQLSYAGVMSHGQPVAEVVAQRLRQYPRDFGLHSTFVVSVSDQEVEEAGRKIVRDLDYTGLIEIEFKRDPRDGSLNLLDINTRVWGWHTLGLRSNVDFAFISWQILCGQEVEFVRIHPGETWIRVLTDAYVALGEVRAKRLKASQYLRSFARLHDRAIFALDDPLPAVWDAPIIARLGLLRRWSSRG